MMEFWAFKERAVLCELNNESNNIHTHVVSMVSCIPLQTYMQVRVFDMFWSMGQIGSTMVSVCVPLGIHIEPINKDLMVLVRI